MPRVWLSEQESMSLVGRSKFTLKLWRQKRLVRTRRYKDSIEYERESLLAAKQAMEWKYEHRRIVPGSGRGHWQSEGQGELW